jgi:hypothetical protein
MATADMVARQRVKPEMGDDAKSGRLDYFAALAMTMVSVSS